RSCPPRAIGVPATASATAPRWGRGGKSARSAGRGPAAAPAPIQPSTTARARRRAFSIVPFDFQFAKTAARPVRRRSGASAAPPAKVEYRVVPLDFDDFKTTDEYKALEKDLRSPWVAQFAYQEKVLNAAGEQGFELIQAIVPKGPSQTILYLKK